MRLRGRLPIVLAVTVAAVAATATPSAAMAPAEPRPQPRSGMLGPAPAGSDYVRKPYGVPASPEEQASLKPVVDEPGKPFDWYRDPRAAVGVLGGPEESIINAAGHVQNAFGTLMLSTGADRTPLGTRIKTWKDGYIPILQSTSQPATGLHGKLEYFAAKVPGVAAVPYELWWGAVGEPRKKVSADVANMVTFVKAELTNTTAAKLSTTLSAGLGTERVRDAVTSLPLPNNRGPARPDTTRWDPDARALVGDGKLLYTASRNPDKVGDTADFTLDLAPGETQSVVFQLPYFVAQAGDASALQKADYAATRASVDSFWHRTLDRAGTVIDVPGDRDEKKVLDTYKAGIALSLIDVDIVDGHYLWDANPTVYDNYWIRDTAFNVNGILNAGFADVARGVALNMLDWQDRDGAFMSNPDQQDGNGQALWTFGMYHRRTKDAAFAREVWPAVQRSMDWEWRLRKGAWDEAGGLFPELFMPDNELVRGHLVGYDLWAIAGERGAVEIARAVGRHDLAREWTARANEYERILRKKLAPAVAKVGWIPPAIEGMDAQGLHPGWYGTKYGIDWGNLEVVFPSGVFAPTEKWVTASLKAWRGKTFEGLFTYPAGGQEGQLHSYTPMSISEAYIRSGRDGDALRDMYSLLAHTSATHSAAEGLNSPQRWGWSQNDETQPHGEFAGKYQTLLRDMLAHEQGGELRLAEILAPSWTKAGERVSFAGDTDFGRVDYRMDFRRDGAKVTLSPPTARAPKAITVGVPDGVKVTAVRVDGKRWTHTRRGAIVLPALRHRAIIDIEWRGTPTASPLSYRRAVADVGKNYRKMTRPPELSLSKPRLVRAQVLAGEPVTLETVLRNRGGASWLRPDQQPTVAVDGKQIAYQFPEVSRGVGFTTPPGVVSFNSHDSGTMPLRYTTRFCAPGKHTLAVSLGSRRMPPVTVTVTKRPPTAPAPPATLTAEATKRYLPAGKSAEVETRFTNAGCEPITGARFGLAAPDGWAVESLSTTDPGPVAPGGSAAARFRVTAPAGTGSVPVAEATLRASTRYGWAGRTTGLVEAKTQLTAFSPVAAPHRTHATTEAYFGQSGEKYAVFAGGSDVWDYTDDFGALYRAGEGKSGVTVTTKVTRQDRASAWSKAGLVARNDLSQARSTGYAILVVTPGNGVALQWDANGDGMLDSDVVSAEKVKAPVWLRLVRTGSAYTGYYSVDGLAWTEVGRAEVPTAVAAGDIGLFASAVNYGSAAMSGVTFDGLRLSS